MEMVSTCSCLGIVEQPPIPIISYNSPQPLDLVVIIIAKTIPVIITIFFIHITISSNRLQPHPLTSLSSSSPLSLLLSPLHHHQYYIIIIQSSLLTSSSPSSLLLSPPHHHHQYNIHFPISYSPQPHHQEII